MSDQDNKTMAQNQTTTPDSGDQTMVADDTQAQAANTQDQPTEETTQATEATPPEEQTEEALAEPDQVESPIEAKADAEAITEEVSEQPAEEKTDEEEPTQAPATPAADDKGRWYVIHTYSGHENKVMQNLKQKIASEHLENRIFDMLVPTQDKIEIRSGKKEQVKEKIFPGYLLVKMDLDDASWLAVRTTPGVTAFVGMGNKPTPISESEVRSIVQFMNQGAPATFKEVFLPADTVKIIDGPFAEFIGKVDSVDKEKGKVRVLVSIFGRETPVELDFLQVQKL
jgi:transcription termination/antitermination protein NusG